MSLHSGTLNNETSHLTGPKVSKNLEILLEVKHRDEASLTNTVY